MSRPFLTTAAALSFVLTVPALAQAPAPSAGTPAPAAAPAPTGATGAGAAVATAPAAVPASSMPAATGSGSTVASAPAAPPAAPAPPATSGAGAAPATAPAAPAATASPPSAANGAGSAVATTGSVPTAPTAAPAPSGGTAGATPAAAPASGGPDTSPAVESRDGIWYTAEGNPSFKIGADGTLDYATFAGYIRYTAECMVCHGPDGLGSSYAPPLKDVVMRITYSDFTGIVAGGKQDVGAAANLVMPAFGNNNNVMCYLDDIYAYLLARGTDELDRGRPQKKEKKSDAFKAAEDSCMG